MYYHLLWDIDRLRSVDTVCGDSVYVFGKQELKGCHATPSLTA